MDKKPIIIIKKIKKVSGHGHHGGAWKVAYADFVTAMMAFFLLMWLLNATTQVQRQGISNYFGPPGNLAGAGGSGGVLGGLTITTDSVYDDARSSGDATEDGDGAKKKTKPGDGGTTRDQLEKKTLPSSKIDESKTADKKLDPKDLAKDNTEKDSKVDQKLSQLQVDKAVTDYEHQNFQEVKDALTQAIEELPELKELAKNLIIDETPEGLRIQIVDQKKYSMFPSGDSTPYDYTVKLLELVTKAIIKLPNKVSITGHTDSYQYKRKDYSNWELSADRANAARRKLEDFGISSERILYVSGRADTEPIVKDNPQSEQNRRISIVLQRTNQAKKN